MRCRLQALARRDLADACEEAAPDNWGSALRAEALESPKSSGISNPTLQEALVDEFTVTLVMAEDMGLVDFSIIPHVEYDDPQDAANAGLWASRLPLPTYALDDQSAVKVVDGTVAIVSEGNWKLFNA